MRWFSGLALALLLGPVASVSAAPPPPPAKDIVAQVNGRAITTQELDAEFHARTRRAFETVQANPQWQRVRKQILEQLINEELLLKEAERQKVSVSPDAIEKRFASLQARFPSEEAFNQELSRRALTAEQLRDNIRRGLMRHEVITKEVVEKVSVSSQEVEAYFENHKEKYVQEETVHARHILILVAPDASPEDDQKAKDKASAVLVRAKKGEDFAKLAQEFSEGPTKDRGGDLGYFGRDQMVKPFEDAAFSLKKGEVSGVVRTKFGYHIIKVEDRQEFKRLSSEEAKDQVKDDLTNEKVNAQYQAYVEELRKKAKVTVNLE